MAFTDSLFLFEIVVEELKSFISCKEFTIKGQFADIFTVHLEDPNKPKHIFPSRYGNQKRKRKSKIKNSKSSDKCTTCSAAATVQMGQSILIAINVDTLISNMKEYPFELSLWSKIVTDYKIGSTHISWSASYYEYLNKLHRKREQQPICVRGDYNLFDENTSRRMAKIKLNVKMSHFKEKISPRMTSIPQEMTAIDSKPVSLLSRNEQKATLPEETNIIKTIYDGSKNTLNRNVEKRQTKSIDDLGVKGQVTEVEVANPKLSRGFITLVRSDILLDNNPTLTIIKSKSCSSIDHGKSKLLNYIFGGRSAGPFGNQVYCVGYFTVANDNSPVNESTSNKSVKDSSEKSKSSKSDEVQERFKFRLCESECLNERTADVPVIQSSVSLDLPRKASHFISVKKCDDVKCTYEKVREVPSPPDDRHLLDLSSRRRDCCNVTETVEEVVGAVKAMMKFGNEPCYCECECQFNFMKKTTYCTICGGYEQFGEEVSRIPGYELPFPCPIYHKILEKKPSEKSKESDKGKSIDEDLAGAKKNKIKKKDSRFKFNYGYTAPHIGHSLCAFPCTGTLGAVPKSMGWLWTAENVPGMKYRGPKWRPGATNKHVVRMLKYAKNPGDFIAKKRRKEKDGKVKRPLKRPLLTVAKKDGEYTVTMETMKTFTKPRTYNQYPYEDKPLVVYTIGRTSEENLQRKIKKERAQRRLERFQRDFVQSAFRDMCQDICLKTYQQAVQMLPGAEDPDCSCHPAEPGPDKVDLDHSCSCSEDKNLSESDTDSDEWLVEFTPPTATFQPKFKPKKVITLDNTTQYTYLDYRVKVLDRLGNPVPRFFKGPDGKQQCSDLGGFWDANHKWLEINVDGFIGPDEKWAPNNFLGPDEEVVDGETGKFQALNGDWLVIGVDGYVDNGKWKFYNKPTQSNTKKKGTCKKTHRDIKDQKHPSAASWSCFGNSASPKLLSKMGIVGHGYDKKLLQSTLKKMLAQGQNVRIPEPSTVPRSNKPRKKLGPSRTQNLFEDKKCKHAQPSNKGIVAIDGRGNKTYFKLKDYKNRRPKERMAKLTEQGISLSSFHVPCLHSFISSEFMKKQQYDRLVALAERRRQVDSQAVVHLSGADGARQKTRSTATDTTATDTTTTKASDYHEFSEKYLN